MSYIRIEEAYSIKTDVYIYRYVSIKRNSIQTENGEIDQNQRYFVVHFHSGDGVQGEEEKEEEGDDEVIGES